LPQDDDAAAATSFQQVAESSYGTSKKYIQKEEEAFYNPFQSLGNSRKSIVIEEEKASMPSQIHQEQQLEGSSLVDAPAEDAVTQLQPELAQEPPRMLISEAKTRTDT
jgi:hypothetical protein